jgi:hypothetical protein
VIFSLAVKITLSHSKRPKSRRCWTTFTKVRALRKVSFEATFHRRFAVLALNVHGLRHRSKTISVFSRLVKDICDLN